MITETDHARIASLRKELHDHNVSYHLWAAPTVSDAEYDRKMVELSDLESKYPKLFDPNSPTQRVGAAERSSFAKVRHASPMLSLEKATTIHELLRFFTQDAAGIVEPKVDGVSLALLYVGGALARAVTRGDGSIGDEVTANARTIRSIPLVLPEPVDIEVRGEVFMRLSDFAKMNSELAASGDDLAANARNAAAGALKLHSPAEASKSRLSFIAYSSPTPLIGIGTHDALLEYFEELGFMSPFSVPTPLRSCQSMTQMLSNIRDAVELTELLKSLEESRKAQDFLADGLVFKLNDLAAQRELGVSNTAPKWGIAFKFPPERVITRINSITIQIGRTGKLTPVAELEPVGLGGITVSRATLNNQEMIKKLNVGIGDDVVIERSGDVIPNVVALSKRLSKNGAYVFPTTCPSCNAAVVRPEGFIDIYCQNPECPAQLKMQLVHATSKGCLNLEGCGESMIQDLMDHGVRNLLDLIRLEDTSFLKPAARKKFEAGRKNACAAPFWRKLCALGIDGFGKTKCQELAARWPSLNTIIDNETALSKLVGTVDYCAFCAFIVKNEDYIADLDAAGFVMADAERAEGPLSGHCFVITGTLSQERGAIEALIMKAGGLVKSSVSKKVHYLIVGNEPGQNKVSAAKKHGIAVMAESELFKKMGMDIPVFVPILDQPEPEY